MLRRRGIAGDIYRMDYKCNNSYYVTLLCIQHLSESKFLREFVEFKGFD